QALMLSQKFQDHCSVGSTDLAWTQHFTVGRAVLQNHGASKCTKEPSLRQQLCRRTAASARMSPAIRKVFAAGKSAPRSDCAPRDSSPKPPRAAGDTPTAINWYCSGFPVVI